MWYDPIRRRFLPLPKPILLVCLTAPLLALGVAAGHHLHAQSSDANANVRTSARVERGRYLVEGPMHCFACHSEANWEKDGFPLPGKKGAGQSVFPDYTLPFKLVVPNITPEEETGAGKWTDAQIARALRQGIGHDGRTLVPVMPYVFFRNLSDEDLAAVIAYLRSVRPVHNPLPKRQLPPPVEQVLQPLAAMAEPVPGPDPRDPVKRGDYLVKLANCRGCHSPINPQTLEFLPGLELAGGQLLKGPWGEVSSANITPDASGISYYDEAMFLKVIRTGHVGARKLNQIMLWRYFRRMTDDDLKAIFAYLRTVKPIAHRVDNTEPPTPCKICGGVHGAGVLNDSLAATRESR